MRQADEVYYLHGDHLGSTSLTTDNAGVVVSEVRYHPYGLERWTAGESPTDFGFTSQRNEKSFGLLDYKARYYSPVLGRFVSPDTIVPEPTSSGGFNRYRYVRNNPLKYTDPSGHFICVGICAAIVIGVVAGAVIGGGLEYGSQAVETYQETQNLSEALSVENKDLNQVATKAAVGAVGGAAGAITGGAGTGLVATIAVGAGSGAVTGVAGRATEGAINGDINLEKILDPTAIATDAVIGGTTGGLGQVVGKAARNKLFDKAYDALDQEIGKVSQLSRRKQSDISAMLGAVDRNTGRTTVGMKRRNECFGMCAEDIAVEQLGTHRRNVLFTEAYRPRTQEIVPVCSVCQTKYSRDQFPSWASYE